MLSRNTIITLLINELNILLTTVLAFFAICGVIFIIRKFFHLKIFNRAPMFIRVFCIAALLAFVLEIVFFNYKSYLKYFADGEFQTTEVSPQDSTIILTTDSVFAKIIVNVDNGNIVSSGLTFKNIDRRVTSIFVKPALFSRFEQLDMLIRWTDEERSRYFTKRLYKGLPHENFIAIQPCGKVSELTVTFPGTFIFDGISQITINKRIPFYFSGLRLLVFSFLFLVVIILLEKEFRAKAAYYLFEYKFNPASKKQNLVYAFVVAVLILFSWLCAYTSISDDYSGSPQNYQYSRFLVDALIDGRVNLDYGHPEKLLNAERPYDINWLLSNGYKLGTDWAFDISYYNGKFYCYYGPAAAVLLYLPYKLVTGNYLSHNVGISVFASIAVVFLALLWRFLVKKYMPNSRFAFYLLAFIALFFTSHLFAGLRYPTVWTIVQVSGLAFSVAGIYLLLKSIEKENINHLKLFFACLCFALVVGCRPNMVFASILIPAVLWKRRSWKLAAFILIPFAMVAIPLCLYNYVRFDSIFEFGQKYTLSVGDGAAAHLLNPLGKIHRTFVTFALYLFRVYTYSVHFPYVEPVPTNGGLVTSALGFAQVYNCGGGLINFPITLCLLYMFKKLPEKNNRPETFPMLWVFLIIAAITLTLFSFIGAMHGRYLMDCAVFIIIPSLFCAYYWANDETAFVRTPCARLGVVYVLLAASVFVSLCLSVKWGDVSPMDYGDPTLYRYLEYSLGIVERII